MYNSMWITKQKNHSFIIRSSMLAPRITYSVKFLVYNKSVFATAASYLEIGAKAVDRKNSVTLYIRVLWSNAIHLFFADGRKPAIV